MLDLINKKFACDCGKTHDLDTEILTAKGDIDKIYLMLKKYYAVSRIAIVYDVAVSEWAQKVLENLVENSFDISEICYEKLTYARKADAEKLINLPENVRFIIGIGSGSIATVVRYASMVRGNDYGLVATAPSTDSYLDNYAVFGDKVEACRSPKFVIADETVYQKSKEYLTASGIGAVFSNFLTIFMLKYRKAIFKEKYCNTVVSDMEKLLLGFVKEYETSNNQSKFLMETLIKLSLAKNYLSVNVNSGEITAYLLSASQESRFYGENLFLASYLVVSLYQSYLSGDFDDTLIPADYVKGLKLLSYQLNEEYNYSKEKFRGYKETNVTAVGYLIKEYRGDFIKFLQIDTDEWAKAFRRCYYDAGFWLRGYLSASDLLKVLSLSGLIAKDSLLGYVKETGFMEDML